MTSQQFVNWGGAITTICDEALTLVRHDEREFPAAMMRRTALDRDWDALMELCRQETELKESAGHPKLLAHLSREIARAARKLGFSEDHIQRREFRAEKEEGRVIRLLTD